MEEAIRRSLKSLHEDEMLRQTLTKPASAPSQASSHTSWINEAHRRTLLIPPPSPTCNIRHGKVPRATPSRGLLCGLYALSLAIADAEREQWDCSQALRQRAHTIFTRLHATTLSKRWSPSLRHHLVHQLGEEAESYRLADLELGNKNFFNVEELLHLSNMWADGKKVERFEVIIVTVSTGGGVPSMRVAQEGGKSADQLVLYNYDNIHWEAATKPIMVDINSVDFDPDADPLLTGKSPQAVVLTGQEAEGKDLVREGNQGRNEE